MNLFVFRILLIVIAITWVSAELSAQDVKWKRKTELTEPDLQLFHSTYSINLPTAETFQQGDWHFGVYHRFNTPVSEGIDDLFGFDGSVTNRLEIGYAPSDKLFLNFGRSNRDGNMDIQAKYKAFQFKDDFLPVLISFMGAVSYNSKPAKEPAEDIRNLQVYGIVIANTLLFKKLGIGVAPAYLHNAHPLCKDVEYSFTFGTYAQYYLNDMWSFLVEYNPTVIGWRDQYDSFAFGFESETGGHFFKLLVGNNSRLNYSQYLTGAGDTFNSGDWHLGFNITRTF